VTVYFPSLVNRFPERAKNVHLYTLSAAYAWAQITQGTLTLDVDISALKLRFKDYPLDHPDIDTLFSLFPERELAVDLYTIIEAFRLEPFLRRELPGLMKQTEGILSALYEDRPELDGLSEKTAFVEALYQYFLAKRKAPAGRLTDSVKNCACLCTGAGEEGIDILLSALPRGRRLRARTSRGILCLFSAGYGRRRYRACWPS
jgi:hypothetical protein